MSGFYVTLIFFGILLVTLSLIFVFLDKKKVFNFSKNFNEKKQELVEIINDAEQMIEELNKFSDYIVNQIDLKNEELSRNLKSAEEKINLFNEKARHAVDEAAAAADEAASGAAASSMQEASTGKAAAVEAAAGRAAAAAREAASAGGTRAAAVRETQTASVGRTQAADVRKTQAAALREKQAVSVREAQAVSAGEAQAETAMENQAVLTREIQTQFVKETIAAEDEYMEFSEQEEKVHGIAVNGGAVEMPLTRKTPVKKNEKVIPLNNKYSEVIRLSQEGLYGYEIAKKLNMGNGEVELILGIRK